MARTANIAATVPEPCRILGTDLAPFCLGHHLLFRKLDMPFDDSSIALPCDSSELTISIAICAGKSYESTLAALLNGEWEGITERWQERVRGPLWNRRRVSWENTEKLFRGHLAKGYALPPIWRHGGMGSISPTAPWEELLKCKLVSAGFSETEVFNGYLPARWYDYFTVSEMRSAEKCTDAKQFRKFFYTEKDDERVNLSLKFAEAGHG